MAQTFRFCAFLIFLSIAFAATVGKPAFVENGNLELDKTFEKGPNNNESALLAGNFTAFVSYRRSVSRSLAMLIKVMLERENISVFLDVEDLEHGFWDEQLISNIRAAPNFILVLSPGTLNRTIGDTNYTDFMHKEIKEAVDSSRIIIPVFDEYDFPPENLFSEEIQTAMKHQGVGWEHALTEASLQKLIRYLEQGPPRSPSNSDTEFGPPSQKDQELKHQIGLQ